MRIEDRKIVLSLNANWQIIGLRTVKDAIIAMCGGTEENPPVKALDIIYPLKDGERDFSQQPEFNPVSWLEWISLPIFEHHLVLNSASCKIRVPSVVVSLNYRKIPKKRFRPNKTTLFQLQKGICGYSGQPISFSQGNLEHKIAKSKNGKDTFENLMVVRKDINQKRGNKELSELGLVPLFNHKEPAPLPASYTIDLSKNADWRWFVG